VICISPRELEIVEDILRECVPDCEVRVFGSRYKRTHKAYSDLDLAIVDRGGGKLSFRKLGELKDAFEESDLPFRVDVVDYNAVSDAFRKIIDAGYETLPVR
jgi:Predicted nucleotidyltransferases